jgi:hypothetical protein
MQKISQHRLYILLLGIYSIALAIGAFTPRPDLETPEAAPPLGIAPSLLPSLGQSILYLDGPLVWAGNFIMLMPLVVLVPQSFPALRMRSIFIICFLTTVFIELIKIFIPGLLSDIRDIFMNCLGVSLAIWIMKNVQSSAGSVSTNS